MKHEFQTDLCAFVALTFIAAAQTVCAQGTAFTYQGRLNDGANPASGNYDLRFTIYDAAGGGSASGVLTNAATGVSNGLFTVTLDFGAGVFTGADRWLDIAVRTDGGSSFAALTPRQPLTPAPYAIMANSASNLLGMLSATQLSAGSITADKLASGAVTTSALAPGAVTGSQMALGTITSANILDGSLTTQDFTNTSRIGLIQIPNPTPSAGDLFGKSVAAVGVNQFVIGAYGKTIDGNPNAGQAYLYDISGTLVTTITNPAPLVGDEFGYDGDDFGYSVAGVGINRFVIGSTGTQIGTNNTTGQAYLYDERGTLVTTITNPAPTDGDQFGKSMAGLGTNRFVIGAPYKAIDGDSQVGRAYLFDLSGALMATITNPAPTAGDSFGYSVTGVGANWFVIGAIGKTVGGNSHVGQAYLYNADGTLLTTITNPVPAAGDFFGVSIAAVGANRFLIGAYGKTIGGSSSAGQAYLYDGSGTLVATITNPAPAATDLFGYCLTGVGTNGFLIGAHGKMIGGNSQAGQAYLYDTGGALMTTITNPAPAAGDWFGRSVAGVGINQFVVGVWGKTIGGNPQAGQAFLSTTVASTPGLIADGMVPNSVGLRQLDINSVDTRYLLRTGDTMTGSLNVRGVISGDGSGLTNLSASQLTSGTLPLALLPSAVVTNNATGLTLGGTLLGYAMFAGNANAATSAFTAINFSGSLSGDVTGTQSATAVSSVGGESAANVASGASAANAATSVATANKIVKRDASGNFSAGSITLGGSLTLPATATATDIIYSGSDSLLRADNSKNLFVGVNAGGLTTGGSRNMGVGYGALFSNTIGSGNTANGSQALFSNTNGLANTANGEQALYNNTSGNYNTAIGWRALFRNTNGNYNFALGFEAGYFLTTGNSNICIGNVGVASDDNIIRIGSAQTQTFIAGVIAGNGGGLTNLNASQLAGGTIPLAQLPGAVVTNGQAGTVTFNGSLVLPATATADDIIYSGGSTLLLADNSDNFFAGVGAGNLTMSGTGNVGVGYGALSDNLSGSFNSANGRWALRHNTSGSYNTAHGSYALNNNTIGSYNIALGYGAGFNLNTGSNNICIGNEGVAGDDSIIRIGDQQTQAFIAGVITGAGGGLTGLNASQLSTGTVPDTRLSANVPLLNNSQTFTGAKTFNNAANSFTGAGNGLTGLNAAQLSSGTVPDARLSANVALLNNSQTFTGAKTLNNAANSFTGNGSGLTSLNASQLSSGTVADARLSANVPLLNGNQTFTGQNTFNGTVTLSSTLRLLDKPIYLRVGTDLAHGLGWFSTGSFGGYNPDGPVLWGNGGGGLGTVSAGTNLALVWNNSGRVGIGRTPTANALEVSGTASKDVAGSWLANSDARIKTGIATVTNAIETLARVRPVSFRYTEEYRAAHPGIKDRTYLNVVAQEFQKVFPDAVQGSGERLVNGEEILQVDPWPLTIYSAAAVQELNQKLIEKDAEIQGLKQSMAELKKLVQTLVEKN
jgi:hypothetical protein